MRSHRTSARGLIRLLPLALLAAFCGGEPDSVSEDGITFTLRRENCARCEIVVESIAYLGDPRDTVVLPPAPMVSVDSRGRFIVASERAGAPLALFDATGRLQQHFGKSGSGPGEITFVMGVSVGLADSILVLDAGSVHVYSPDLRFARQFSYSSPGDLSWYTRPMADGRLIRGQPQSQFSLLSMDGTESQPVRLSGADSNACLECGLRGYLEDVDNHTLWSIARNELAIAEYDLAGKLLRRYVRDAPWFPAWTAGTMNAPSTDGIVDQLSRPRMTGAWSMPGGQLWTFSVARDPDREIAPAFVKQFGGASMEGMEVSVESVDMVDLLSHLRSHIEVIDTRGNQLIRSGEFPRALMPLDHGLALELVSDSLSGTAWKVYRLSLKR